MMIYLFKKGEKKKMVKILKRTPVLLIAALLAIVLIGGVMSGCKDQADTTSEEISSTDQTSETTTISVTPGFTIFSFIAFGGILILKRRLR